MLLLDEVGLAEHSPHRPLKVLHQLLEDPQISFVGLSNWPLDAAKMNRANMHLWCVFAGHLSVAHAAMSKHAGYGLNFWVHSEWRILVIFSTGCLSKKIYF